MKVLFVGNPSTADTDGGSATFQRSIVSKLTALPECTFILPRSQIGEVAHWVQKKGIDLVWFLSPYWEDSPAPFVTTVWDLGHRQLPHFPEVSNAPGGTWTWEAREAHYTHVLPRAARVCCAPQLHPLLTQIYGVQPEQLVSLPLCVDVEALRAGIPGNATLDGLKPMEYLLYPAQFWPHKNHITLVDMLKILHDRHRLKLVFTGADKGNRAYVEKYAAHNALSDQVIFTGFVSTDTLHQLYRDAFALVYASLMGPDNLPPLEAMALECPVICAEYPGATDQLGEAALYFDPLSRWEAAQAVVHLLEQPNLRQSKIERGRALVTRRSPEHYIDRVRQVIADLALSRRLWAAPGMGGTAYRHL